jgi:methyl-accepting chemotaxis protein
MIAIESTTSLSRDMATLYQDLLSTINGLNLKTTSMRRILELLKNITDETHLLSLNAAIEAAGAGEHGERFKVVAQEVKRLASRSAQSNNEVIQIIREVENASSEALRSAEAGYKKARELEEAVNQTGEVFGEMGEVTEASKEQVYAVLEAVKEVNHLSEIIRVATTEQRSASWQVNQALNGLSTVAHQLAEASSQVSTAAESLEKLSYNLNRSFSQN